MFGGEPFGLAHYETVDLFKPLPLMTALLDFELYLCLKTGLESEDSCFVMMVVFRSERVQPNRGDFSYYLSTRLARN